MRRWRHEHEAWIKINGVHAAPYRLAHAQAAWLCDVSGEVLGPFGMAPNSAFAADGVV